MNYDHFMKEHHFDKHSWNIVKVLIEKKGWRIADIVLLPPPARNVDLPPTQQAERFQQKPT